MSDQQSTQSLHSPSDLGTPTPTQAGADGSMGVGGSATLTANGVSPETSLQGTPKKQETILEVDRLVKYFPVRGGLLQRTVAWVKAVDDVTFSIKRGETLGLVGESGCGKTTVGRTILRLLPATSGRVLFEKKNIYDYSPGDMKKLRRDIQIIFQDPFSSLDPRVPIGESIGEGLIVHGIGKAERHKRIADS